MADEKCAKCGEILDAGALSCWACGTLTEAGRQAKGEPADEAEVWRRSVEAAKARQKEKPAVDADEVLRQVIAKTGTEEQVQRAVRGSHVHDEFRSDQTRLRGSARTIATVGLLVAVLFAVAGLLAVVAALMVLSGGPAFVLGLAGLLVCSTAAIAFYLICRALSELSLAVADTADNVHRTVLLLREHPTRSEERLP